MEIKEQSIRTFGDLAIASGPVNFNDYLSDIQISLKTAQRLSMDVGTNPKQKEKLNQLRDAFIDSYTSILHGIFNHSDY